MKTSLTEWFQGATSGEEEQEGEQLIDKSQEQHLINSKT